MQQLLQESQQASISAYSFYDLRVEVNVSQQEGIEAY